MTLPVILITGGDPAGIGPDLCVALAKECFAAKLLVIADPDVIAARAKLLNQPLKIAEADPSTVGIADAQQLYVWPHKLAGAVRPGVLNPENAAAVLHWLDIASTTCVQSTAAAMVTLPIQKSVLTQVEPNFTGHTEYLAKRLDAKHPLMLLVADQLRVALVTTHLPLRAVADAISHELITIKLATLHQGLRNQFGINQPRIAVLGLNPHAGENGHMGREEIDIIAPAIESARKQGMLVEGPWPADTAFTSENLQKVDVHLAMYHDQGLPVLKHIGFERAVNITLGLPITRTSVDHGTALDIAGSGRAHPGSFFAAIRLAIACSQ